VSGPTKMEREESLFGTHAAASQAMLAGPGASRASRVEGDWPEMVSVDQDSDGFGWRSGMEAAILSTLVFCDASSLEMASVVVAWREDGCECDFE